MIDLKEIISIAGKPGLYKLVTQSKKGIIVESLVDGKKIPAQSTHKISALEDISIYTDDEEMPLGEVFQKIHEQEDGKASMDHKSNKEDLREYFREIVPEFDEERVYSSDIKKVFQWYNILHNAELLIEQEEEAEEEANQEKEEEEKTDKSQDQDKKAKTKSDQKEEN